MDPLKKPFQNNLNSLAANVLRLSKMLTKERAGLPAAYLRDAGLRKAYLAYFLPSNLRKIHIPLDELALHPKNVFSKERLRILDIGSGPGTAALGALEFFSRQAQTPFLELTAADPVVENLEAAEALFNSHQREHAVRASLHTVKYGVEELERHLKGQFDLIILSNLLNELFPRDPFLIAKRVGIVRAVAGRFLADDGSCIIIEPALHETSREMLQVRDGLLEGGLHIYSPCLTTERCPALVNPRDWCHEDVPWDPPEIVKEIDRVVGLRKDSLKFSYLTLRKDSLALTDVHGTGAFRVVSEPLVSKGKLEFYVCGRGGRRLVTRLDRDATSSNEIFRELKRGDVLAFESVIDEGKRYKVGKETKVTLLYPVREQVL